MSQISLNALRTFERVASRLSFSAAAEDLFVTPAAVSSQIRALEERLGQSLFVRHGRSISLTRAGSVLLPGVQEGLRLLHDAVQSVQQERDSGVLNVSMLASFMQAWMAPRLPSFLDSVDGIDLRMSASDAPVDFRATDFHAAVRFGRGRWAGLKAQKLIDDWVLPVCSPQLLARYGPLDDPHDTGNYPLLANADESWERWRGVASMEGATKGPTFDDTASIVAAAENGLGLGLVRWSLAASKFEHGTLVTPSSFVRKSPYAYYFVAPEHLWATPKVERFRSWLVGQAEQFPEPPLEALGWGVSA